MTHRHRLATLALAIVLLGGIKLSQQLYRFYSSKEERTVIARLEEEVEDAGFGIISTQMRLESLRQRIDTFDDELRLAREELDTIESRLSHAGSVSPSDERSYRTRLDAYNLRVNERNSLYREWRTLVDINRTYVERYNVIVDSIRTAATTMGEPYYPIPTPAEIAARREAMSDTSDRGEAPALTN